MGAPHTSGGRGHAQPLYANGPLCERVLLEDNDELGWPFKVRGLCGKA